MQCLCGSYTGLLHTWFHYKTALEQHGFCSSSILFQHYSSCKLQVSISPFWSFNSGADFKPCRITTAPTASTGAAAGVGAGAGSTSSLKAACKSCRLWMKTQASNESMVSLFTVMSNGGGVELPLHANSHMQHLTQLLDDPIPLCKWTLIFGWVLICSKISEILPNCRVETN